MAGVVDLIQSYGYTFEGTCNCDGFKTYKYKNGAYQFRWRVNTNKFKMKHHGVTKTTWKDISQAEELLKTIHVESI